MCLFIFPENYPHTFKTFAEFVISSKNRVKVILHVSKTLELFISRYPHIYYLDYFLP
jgi:hypothetical protein